MRILITNFYNGFNFGTCHDLLLAKKLFPSSTFYIFSFPTFYANVKNVRLISPQSVNQKNFFNAFVSYLILMFIKRKQIRECQFIIDLAGDYLNDINYSIFHPLLYFLNLLPAIIYKKKFIIFFQSIGPLKLKMNRILAKFLLQKASLIIVRESYSYKCVKKLGINKEKIILCSTPVVFNKKIKKKEYIGIFVDKNFEYAFKGKKYDLIKFYIEIINYFLGKNEKVMLLQQVIGPRKVPFPLKNIGDYSIIEKIITELDSKKVLVPSTKNLEDFIKNIAKCKFCIVSKFHSLRFILALKIPFVCISYNKKTEYLLKDSNLIKYYFSAKKLENFKNHLIKNYNF